jgi:Type I phosphodiesterase / nucleotide pyrophosphatase
VLAGRPVVYTTFLAYDEVAHHSGVERRDTLETLSHVDRQIARVEAALADAPRPYRLVVLSDHGQSQGATFLQRYGLTLEQLVSQTVDAESTHAAAGGEDEALAYLSAGLTELARDDTRTARVVRGATRKRQADGSVELTVERRDEIEASRERDVGVPELSVMASGCLGLITFPREPGRVTYERLEELCPRLIPTLAGHPGIGFVLVRSEADGPLVIGTRGIHYLDSGTVIGEDPLAPFGPNAALHVRRTDGFAHCPDIVVNSTYWADTDEVAAFEELVGSHGGMGGGQSFPFVLFPTELAYPESPVVGAESMHQVLRGWLAALGQEGYRSLEAPGSRTLTSTSGASSRV